MLIRLLGKQVVCSVCLLPECLSFILINRLCQKDTISIRVSLMPPRGSQVFCKCYRNVIHIEFKVSLDCF